MVNKILTNIAHYSLVLASNSPRRRELLESLGLKFEVRTLERIDESYPTDLADKNVPLYLACKKAQAYLSGLEPAELLITADTVVCLDGKILGKPHSADEAKAMLRQLAGKTHHVITGVALTTTERQKSFSVTSEVEFGPLSEEEITYYVENYRPLDKAGAYGIQEWIGMVAVRELRGSFFNVMGLPVQRLYHELKRF